LGFFADVDAEQQRRMVGLRRELAKLIAKVREVEDELVILESEGHLKLTATNLPVASLAPRSPREKVALFLELFATRQSVYPKRWENERTGKNGYAPACDNEWRHGICEKPG